MKNLCLNRHLLLLIVVLNTEVFSSADEVEERHTRSSIMVRPQGDLDGSHSEASKDFDLWQEPLKTSVEAACAQMVLWKEMPEEVESNTLKLLKELYGFLREKAQELSIRGLDARESSPDLNRLSKVLGQHYSLQESTYRTGGIVRQLVACFLIADYVPDGDFVAEAMEEFGDELKENQVRQQILLAIENKDFLSFTTKS